MRTALKRVGTGLLFLLAAPAFLGALVPPLLDQHYYDGPVSDHYDGARFFNPGTPNAARPTSRMARFFSGVGKAEWPERVPVTPRVPAAVADPDKMTATWIGHATVLVQAGGVNILTDPIWSERASPVQWAGPKRARAPGIRLADLPRIDVIVVSHNHYDHMDLPTLKALWDRDRPTIVTGLGNDTILRRAGIGAVAADWGQTVRTKGIAALIERNHHWGSRYGTDRNRALWSSFRIETPAGAIYHAGDTGYGDGSWAAEAAARGPIRLAILPIGAYEPRDVMKENHVNPAEAVRVFDALRPRLALGMHWGTFQLTFEAIDAPPRELARVRGSRNFVVSEVGVPVVVPEVGATDRTPSRRMLGSRRA